MDNGNQKKKLFEFLPILGFLIVYFLVQSFSWMEATKIIIAVIVSFSTFMIMVSLFKEDYELNQAQQRQINFQIGFLTLVMLLMLVSGFLSWYRIVSNFMRIGILFIMLLVYFVVLFRSMRILSQYKNVLKPKQK
jgi:hypothetical protein